MVNFAKVVGFPTKLFGATDDLAWQERMLRYGETTFYPQIAQKYDTYRQEFASWEDFEQHQQEVLAKASKTLGKTPAFRRFKGMAMGRFCEAPDLPTGDIYSEATADGVYLSVDIRQANVVILTHYARGVFAPYKSYEEWLGQFTDSQFVKGLKEIRLELLKKSGSWKQGKLQQNLMNSFHEELSRTAPELAKLAISINRDELIFDVTSDPLGCKTAMEAAIRRSRSPVADHLGTELFRVVPLGRTGGVIRIGDRDTRLKKMQPMFIPVILSLAANGGQAPQGLELEVPLDGGGTDRVAVDSQAFLLVYEKIPVEVVKKAEFVATILGDHPWSWYQEQLDPQHFQAAISKTEG